MTTKITAEMLTDRLRAAFEQLEQVDAMWLGGSKAFGRDDELSDLDVQFEVEADWIEQGFALVEQVLSEVSPISARNRMAEPAWHGMSQCFYQLADAPEHLMIDLCFRRRGNREGPQFNEIEIHGNPVILFDKTGCVNPVHINMDEQVAKARARVPYVAEHFRLYRHLPDKELQRGNPIDALNFYNQMVLATLMRLLRIRYDPARYDWGSRYLHHHLPADVHARLEPLYFVADSADLERKYMLCRKWIEAELRWWENQQS
ncbi:MAG: hypothetical protein H7A35_11580 [Planctomycetales bacterium]|nr:hypothetical protein [bacterium]UNM07500.1 MAG: hypothetical protein H7A35_11580 [Planctomycetales bacterium]